MTSTETKSTPRLKTKYLSEVRPLLQKSLGFKNELEIPRVTKIVVNMGVKGAVESKAKVEVAAKNLGQITGQLPTIRKAKHAIANFKLREGMPIGCAVTLRGDRMWEFMDRLFAVVLPRIRDFRGVKDKLDGRGNFTMGLAEQSVFPELTYDMIDFPQGMDITFVTTAESDEHAYELLKELGMPFRKPELDEAAI
jgi:large subunit ribosomal protein L5